MNDGSLGRRFAGRNIMEIAITITQIILYIACIFAGIRLIKGPRLMDRVISLDGIAIAVIGLLALESIKTQSPFFIDLILVFSIFNFIGTVAYVYYLSHKYSVIETADDAEVSLHEGSLTSGIGRDTIRRLIKGEELEP
jgi:multicomponent Na+:H+ antiporter subunit F